MASLIEDVLIRIRGDSSTAQTAINAIGGSWTELKSKVDLAKDAFRLVSSAAETVFDALNRGQTVEGVSRAFQTLQAQAGLLADDSLQKLRVATRGLVDDFSLMQQANQAVQLGLDPSNLDVMAEAARKLGAAVGRDTNEAFRDLITGVGRASPLILDNLGITIKAEEAYQRYAASLGKSKEQLSELEKSEAFRIVAMEKIKEKALQLADADLSAAEAAKQVKVTFDNLLDTLAQNLSQNEELSKTLQDLNTTLANVDPAPFVAAINSIAGAFSTAVIAAENFARGIAFITDPTNLGIAEIEKLTKPLIENAKTSEDFSRALRLMSKDLEVARANYDALAESGFHSLATWQRAEAHITALEGAIEELGKKMNPGLLPTIGSLISSVENFNLVLPKAPPKVKEVAAAADDAEKALAKLKKEFIDFASKVAAEDIQGKIKKSLEIGESFDDLKTRLTQAYYEGIVAGIEKAGQSPAVLEQARINAAQKADADIEKIEGEVLKAEIEANEKAAKDRDERFKASADFFSDALYNAMTGAAFDAEDIMKRVLAGVAGGFLSQITDGAFGDLGNLQGLGQTIGSSIASGTLFSTLGGLAGGTAGAGAIAGGLPDLSGFPIIGGYPGIAQAGPGLTLFEMLGPLAAAAGTAYSGSRFGQDLLNGRSPSWLDAGVLAPVTGGFSLAGPLAGGLLGSGKDSEQQMRDAFRDALREAGVTNERDEFGLFGGGVGSLSPGGEFNGLNAGAQQYAGIGNLLQTLSGGAEGAGIAELFANALAGAEDFNHAALTTLGLLEKMGFNAETAKEALLQAFLEEKISLEELNAEVATVNSLQIDSLPQITDAWKLLASTIDGPPRDSIRAFEIAMNTLRQSGIEDINQLFTAIETQLGPEARAIFEELKAHGIDQFTDLSTLSVDQVVFLLNEIARLSALIQNEFGDIGNSGEEAGSNIERGMRRASGATEEAGRLARRAAGEFEHLNRVARRFNSGSGVPQGNG